MTSFVNDPLAIIECPFLIINDDIVVPRPFTF